MLQVIRLRDLLGDELMLPDFGDRTNFVDFVNEGLGLWSQHPWRYLSGRRFEIGVTVDKDLFELPPEVLDVTSARVGASGWPCIDILSEDEFAAIRLHGSTRVCATVIDQPASAPEMEGELVPWLEFLPGHGLDGFITVVADVDAGRVEDGNEKINVPRRLEPAMIAFLRALARGRFDVDAGGVERQMEMLYQSTIWRGALQLEGARVTGQDIGLGPAGKIMANRGMSYDEDGPYPGGRHR